MNLRNQNIDHLMVKNHKNGQLFLLVDGAQIDQEHVINIEYTYGSCIYLFKGTYEEDAYQYGPILFDLSQLSQDQLENQIKLMRSKDSMILIESTLDIKQFKNKLLEKLYIKFEDGSIGILRYYDPRVMNRLSFILDDEQKNQLLDGIESIYFTLNQVDYEITNND